MTSISTYWGLDDWRAPGSKWLRTQQGWRRQFSAVNDGNQAPGEDNSVANRYKAETPRKPFHSRWLHVSRNTRESSQYVTLGDALQKLDVCGVLHDSRRLLFVCQVLKEILTHRLGSLSGTTLNYVITTIETAVQQVVSTQMHIQVVRDLLAAAESSPNSTGSKRWKTFCSSIPNWQHDLEKSNKTMKQGNSCLKILDLPDDCLLLILDRLDNHKDIINLSQSCRKICHLCDTEKVWKNLCLFHFTKKQIDVGKSRVDCKSWKILYLDLTRQHKGSCDVGPAVLRFCQECQALYWQV